MAEKVPNLKICSPLKLHFGMTGRYHVICHYSHNLPLAVIGAGQFGYLTGDTLLTKISNVDKCTTS